MALLKPLKVKIRNIGNSSGVILGKKQIELIGAEAGDEITIYVKMNEDQYIVLPEKSSDFDSNEQNATIGVQSYHTYQNGILGNANARTGVTGI